VTAREDADLQIAAYSYDGLGRRVKKVVTNSGNLDGTVLYFHDGQKVIEVRDGSENVVRQVIFGSIEHVCLTGVIFNGEIWPDNLTDELCEFIFRGIAVTREQQIER